MAYLDQALQDRRPVAGLSKKVAIIFYYLVIFGLLFFGYYEFIVPAYGSLGFEWQPDGSKIVESILLTILLATVLPAHFDKPSDFFTPQLFSPRRPSSTIRIFSSAE